MLIDTPGFDDTQKLDSEVLRTLYNWLKSTYSDGRKLNAIVYLHNITDKRMRGSSFNNLNVFRKLCGENFFSNVLLGTNFWSDVKEADRAGAEAREAELKTTDDFWKKMIQGGAQTCRVPDTRPKALDLLIEVVIKQPQVLLIQREAVEGGRTFENITAHEALDDEVTDAKRQHEREMASLTYQLQRSRDDSAARTRRLEHQAQHALQVEAQKIQRRQKAQEEFDIAYRRRVGALQKSLDEADRRENKLDSSMEKLGIANPRDVRMRDFTRRYNVLADRLVPSSRFVEQVRPLTAAYCIKCNHCLELIGAGTYWRK